MAGVRVTPASGLSAVANASFLTATVTGTFPSVALRVGAVVNPGPEGNGFTPACTMCCSESNKTQSETELIHQNLSQVPKCF